MLIRNEKADSGKHNWLPHLECVLGGSQAGVSCEVTALLAFR
jgi:hypothetical protein